MMGFWYLEQSCSVGLEVLEEVLGSSWGLLELPGGERISTNRTTRAEDRRVGRAWYSTIDLDTLR